MELFLPDRDADSSSQDSCVLGRRSFLGGALGACSLALWPRLPAAFGDEAAIAKAAGKARSIIVLWMAGGPSHIDTFDPKPGTAVAGEFKAIPTAIKGVQFSEHLPRLAKAAGDLCLLRAMSTKEGNHRRASYIMRTGYAPAGPVEHPGLGALMSKYRGKESFDLPNFVSVNGTSIGGGFLGVEHSPFVVNDPQRPVDNLFAPGSVDRKRFQERWELLEKAEKKFSEGRRQDMVEGHRKIYEKAERFMHSKLSKAFDISSEPEKLRASYGANRFGAGCLMARRLVEVGVPFVEVTLGGWDTHTDNWTKIKELSGQLDPAFSTLIADLKDRKLLDSTLVIWTGDFGRTPKISGRGGRDHYPRAWTTIVAGAGTAKGTVIGDSGRTGEEPTGRPISAGDLFATVAQLTGIDPAVENISKAGRPIRVIDKDAKIISEML